MQKMIHLDPESDEKSDS